MHNLKKPLKFRVFFFRYRSGQEAMVVCDIGYEIRSSASGSKIQCKEDGSWQPAIGSQFPICQGESVTGRNEREKYFPDEGVIDLPSSQINGFFYKKETEKELSKWPDLASFRCALSPERSHQRPRLPGRLHRVQHRGQIRFQQTPLGVCQRLVPRPLARTLLKPQQLKRGQSVLLNKLHLHFDCQVWSPFQNFPPHLKIKSMLIFCDSMGEK